MRLFTIGDSLAQGFMSGAAAQTDLCFSSHVANQLGIVDYQFPHWPHGGLPINIERVLRRLNKVYGSDISGFEWLFVLNTVNGSIDPAEDYYERGDGGVDSPYRAPPRLGAGAPEFFHNVSIWGFEIADAWQVTPSLCREMIEKSEDVWFEDGFLEGPSGSFYRIALQVLNPSRQDRFEEYTQLSWLEHHVESEGVENLILWLGNNNVLGTAIDLEIRSTPGDPASRPADLSHERRAKRRWNLWHPDDFKHEYQMLIDKVLEIMGHNQAPWRVFLCNVPHVTIPPLTKGLEPSFKEDGKTYFSTYTYVPFGKAFAQHTGRFLTGKQAIFIDQTIDQYNAAIEAMGAAANSELNGAPVEGTFHVVDFNQVLSDVAYKRNDGNPTYKFPDFFDTLARLPTAEYYDVTRDGEIVAGGLFSLDGIHPSVIGQGVLAYELAKVMKAAGVVDAGGNPLDPDGLDWSSILGQDALLRRPISLMREIYEHERLATLVVKAASLLGKRTLSRFDF